MSRLHLGCGIVKLSGYINIDADPNVNPDMVLDLTTPLPYLDNSIDEIITYHFIEHLRRGQAENLIKECYRILKKGGFLTIECPDILEICRAFVKGDESQRYLSYRGGPALITHIYGLQSNQWEYHKTGFDKAHLTNLLKNIGFSNIIEEEANKVIKDYLMPALRLKAIK